MDKTDTQLITEIKLYNSNDALKQLSERHSGLYMQICQKYTPAIEASGSYMQDVTADKDFVVFKAALSYDETRNVKFSTWFGNQARFYCLKHIDFKHPKVSLPPEELNQFIDKREGQNNEHVEFEQFSEYVKNILEQIQDKRIRKVFELRYANHDKVTTWATIGKKMGVSTQTAINLHSRGLKMLRQKVSSNCSPDTI
jgi:RNA polymerase sigma factor (sigma-70 family)